jgi:hypothetical protein
VRGNRLVQSDKAAPAREIQLLIGEALKAQYDLGLPEPIPDRLGELLKQLAQPMDERDGFWVKLRGSNLAGPMSQLGQQRK